MPVRRNDEHTSRQSITLRVNYYTSPDRPKTVRHHEIQLEEHGTH